MYEERTVDTDDSPEHLSRFGYSNHLGSAALELDESAAIISYEEYHPYGTMSYQAMNASINAVAKRYRYTGKERDEESGLYYHSARYYAAWLARWTAVDPLEGKYAPQSCYTYCSNNPVMRHDPDGRGDKNKLKATIGQERAVTPSRTYQEGNVTVIETVKEAPGPIPTGPKVAEEVKELTKDLPKGGEQISKEFAEEVAEELTRKEAKNTGEQAAESLLKKLAKIGRHVNIVMDIIEYAITPVELGKGDVFSPEQQYQQVKANPQYAKLHLKSGLTISKPTPGSPIAPPQRVTNQPNKLTDSEIASAKDRIAKGIATAMDKLYEGFGWLNSPASTPTPTPAPTPVAPRIISSMSAHAVNQAILRGFKVSDILTIVRKGTATLGKSKFGTPQWRYMLGGNTVIIDSAKNRVITIFSNVPGTRKKLGAGGNKSTLNK